MRKQEALHKINKYIRAQVVRLVGDNIEEAGIVSIEEALK